MSLFRGPFERAELCQRCGETVIFEETNLPAHDEIEAGIFCEDCEGHRGCDDEPCEECVRVLDCQTRDFLSWPDIRRTPYEQKHSS